jgi:hypothetical protein
MPKGLERVQRKFCTNEPCTMDEHSGSAATPRTRSGPKDIRDQLSDINSAIPCSVLRPFRHQLHAGQYVLLANIRDISVNGTLWDSNVGRTLSYSTTRSPATTTPIRSDTSGTWQSV